MQAWRRRIAILMILLFAPNTVVAAGPLNLCLGSDGHRVIEPLLEMHHHKGHTEAGESNRASKGAADSEVVTAGPLPSMAARSASYSAGPGTASWCWSGRIRQ